MAKMAEPTRMGLERRNQAAILRAHEADRIEPRADGFRQTP